MRLHCTPDLTASLFTWCCGGLQTVSFRGVEPTLWVLEEDWNQALCTGEYRLDLLFSLDFPAMSPSKAQVILAGDSRVGQPPPSPLQVGSFLFLACPPTFPLPLLTSVCSGVSVLTCSHVTTYGPQHPFIFSHIIGTAFFLTFCEEASL